MSTLLFLGPTLPRTEALALLPGAHVLPPVQQGDLFRAVQTYQPETVGIVDGAFLQVPAVWHREILWALDAGVRVLGAGSMGALRAAELHMFGMEGVGAVFAAYRDGVLQGWDGPFEDDDEVAVVHAPPELGSAPLSDAMVDLRAILLRAEAVGLVTRAERDRLAATLKRLHFPQRTRRELARVAGPELAAFILADRGSAKADDARELLAAMARPRTAPPMPFRRERALVWEAFVQRQADHPMLQALRHDPAAWDATARAALERSAALAAVPPYEAPPVAALRRFRAARGLWRRADLAAWMAARGIDEAELERLLREEEALDLAARRGVPALRRTMRDLLLLSTGDAVP